MTPTAKAPIAADTGARPWRAPAEALLTTADGVRVHAAHTPRRGGSGDLAIMLVHGFTGSVERPAVQRAAEVFAEHAGVVTFSLRGHGRSGGSSTVGAREVLDLDAAVGWARSLGYRRIVTVGFSLGGAVAVRHGAVCGGVAAVAAVSAPARWYYRGTVPMRRLHWVVMRPLGRVVGRVGLRTRIDAAPWPLSTGGGLASYSFEAQADPLPPVGAAAVLAAQGIPLLVVHGDADPYFPLDHPRSLAEAYGEGAELWIERGFGHAENAAGRELLERIGGWLADAASDDGDGAGRSS